MHTDGGKELISHGVEKVLSNELIKLTHTSAGTPQLNGLAERRQHTVYLSAVAMLHSSRLPEKLWPYAIQWASTIDKVTPTNISTVDVETDIDTTISITPYEAAIGVKPSIEKFIEFGSLCVYIDDPTSEKQKSFTPKGTHGRIVGMAPDARTPIYLVYNPTTQTVVRTGHVVIDRTWSPKVDDAQDINLEKKLSLATTLPADERTNTSDYAYLKQCIVLESSSGKLYYVNAIRKQSEQLQIHVGHCYEIKKSGIHVPIAHRINHHVTPHAKMFTTSQLDHEGRLRE